MQSPDLVYSDKQANWIKLAFSLSGEYLPVLPKLTCFALYYGGGAAS